jgi:nitrogen fixation protein NifB
MNRGKRTENAQLRIVQPVTRTARQLDCTGLGASSKGECGSTAGPKDLNSEVWEKIKNHPCYSEEAHHHYARIHLAVAPACNIQCNYCNRKYDCSNESRPGVVSERLTPEQAAHKALAVAMAIPQMTVVGIAGPGDPLANPQKTFRTFELISKSAPDLKLCLSTNGLMLPDYIDRIQALKIDHVTITINMVDPEVGAKIYPWIYFRKKRYTGIDASTILSEQQLRGLEMLTARGILCKVNSVMIPGINDQHLLEVNRAVRARGAFLHNIMPMVSAPEHGTVFGLQGVRGPSASELKTLQDACEGEMKMMRHCRQCRADAVGLLGEDRGAEFSLKQLHTMSTEYDPSARLAYQKEIERHRRTLSANHQVEMVKIAGEHNGISILIAVASKGNGLINEHFGHAKEFQIYEVGAAGAKFIGHRRVDLYCKGGYAEEDSLPTVIRAVNDCTAIFVAKIGNCPRKELQVAGIDPVDTFAYQSIQQSLVTYYWQYLDRVKQGKLIHLQRGDAVIRQGALIA